MADRHDEAAWESDASQDHDELLEVEVLDGELVPVDQLLADTRDDHGRSLARASVPIVQTAVAAATGFVAGAATLALLRRYGSRAALEAATERERPPVPVRRGGTYLITIRPLVPPE